MVYSKLTAALQRRFAGEEQARLQRILTRANVDCEMPMATLGTGAQCTRKRAVAVQMALEGASADAIAKAVSLTRRRVLQVLTHVAENGLRALYPTFAEGKDSEEDLSAANLWEKLKPIVSRAPRERECLLRVWTPATLLDYAVYSGIVEDSSVARILHTVEKNKRWNDEVHWEDSESVPESSDEGPISEIVFFGVGGLLILGGLVFFKVKLGGLRLYLLGGAYLFQFCSMLYRWIEERKFLREVLAPRSAGAESRPTETDSPGTRRDRHRPAPRLILRHASALPLPPWSIDDLTVTANASGLEPIPTLYLWAFKAHREQFVYETHGWPQLGPVHLLLTSWALASGELRKIKKVVIRDPKALKERIQDFKDAPGEYKRPTIFLRSPDRKSRYRGYPIHPLVCTDLVWKAAFDELAGRSRMAVFNLSGFEENYPGLGYEISHVLSGGAPKQFVFLYDRLTDADGAIERVLKIWGQAASEKRPDNLVFLRYQDAQLRGYGEQFGEVDEGAIWDYIRPEGPYRPVAGGVIELLRSLGSSASSRA